MIDQPSESPKHKSGYVNIIGRPNVGKSTLMNALVGEQMSIITRKPQTTRHRIIGIVDAPDHQIVFSDTPGIIEQPAYKMQEAMNSFVHATFEDADLFLFVVDVQEKFALADSLLQKLQKVATPIFLVINKVDLVDATEVLKTIKYWNDQHPFNETIPISALQKSNTDKLLHLILNELPSGPKYYPSDQLTDRSERFFVSEIIREKVLLLYEQEIPYSVEVVVLSFEETTTKKGEPLIRIEAEIFVARATQKSILIGKQGSAIKRLGTEARKSLEQFFESQIFLNLHVKVKAKWRDDERLLKHFGY